MLDLVHAWNSLSVTTGKTKEGLSAILNTIFIIQQRAVQTEKQRIHLHPGVGLKTSNYSVCTATQLVGETQG